MWRMPRRSCALRSGGIVGGVNAVLAYRAEASLGEQIDLLRGEGLLEDVYRD